MYKRLSCVRLVVVAVLLGCGSGGSPQPAAQAAGSAAPRDAAPACSRTLRSEPFSTLSPIVHRIAWVDDKRLVVAYEEGRPDVHEKSSAGIAMFDLAKPDAPLAMYRVPAIDLAMKDDRTALLLLREHVATLDVTTGCLRESESLEVVVRDSVPLATFDHVRGRFFLLTKYGFVRVDAATMKVDLDVPRPRTYFVDLAYDPTSDRLVARTRERHVHLFDPATLAEVSTFDLPDRATDGPWVRPGHAEAAFGIFIECKERKSSPPGHPPAKAAPCLDKPGTFGSFTVRVELPSGRVLASERFTDEEYSTMSEPAASWSADGKQLVVVDSFGGSLYEAGGKRTPLILLGKTDYVWKGGGSFPKPFSLGPTGAIFAAPRDDHMMRVGDTVSGTTTWTATLP